VTDELDVLDETIGKARQLMDRGITSQDIMRELQLMVLGAESTSREAESELIEAFFPNQLWHQTRWDTAVAALALLTTEQLRTLEDRLDNPHHVVIVDLMA